ncbi:1493_t:CDS:2 [Acaulospora colombiana]|uniref:1493_t:CDS:1 n=1 Tax=Acaulospora colombiana TaxID=27376 RepID=A0ACA9QIS2_9GLOM|nr:1493_t:CDS:2 [Acaulospora colombiana]
MTMTTPAPPVVPPLLQLDPQQQKSMKNLILTVVQAFYEPKHIILMDMLLRHCVYDYQPVWRNVDLSEFLHKLDQGANKLSQGANKLSRHITSESKNQFMKVPRRLPINWYCRDWMSNLKDEETLRLAMKHPIDFPMSDFVA